MEPPTTSNSKPADTTTFRCDVPNRDGSTTHVRGVSPMEVIARTAVLVASNPHDLQTARFYFVFIGWLIVLALLVMGKIPASLGALAVGLIPLGFKWLSNNRQTANEAASFRIASLIADTVPASLPHTTAPAEPKATDVSGSMEKATPAVDAAPSGAASGVAGAGVAPGIIPSSLMLLCVSAASALIFLCGCAARTTFWDVTTGKKVAEFQGDMTDSDWTGGKKPHWKVGSVSHSAATDAMGRAVGHIVNQTGKAATSVGLDFVAPGAGPVANGVGKVAGFGTVLANPGAATPTPATKPATH